MRPRLQGEWLRAFDAEPDPAVQYTVGGALPHVPLTWFRSTFATPANASSTGMGVHINMTGFSRGHAWVNGHNIGRIWSINGQCNVPDTMTFCEDWDEDSGVCDTPTQSLYHVPIDWLHAPGSSQDNQIVVFDELGAKELSPPAIYVRALNPGLR